MTGSKQMMSVSSTQLSSLSSKGGEQLTTEEERDKYRQGYSNMLVIIKELQQQLAQYKVRCAGVDTLAVVLKEAKQESVTLARQKKALETAIANLQNRLSTNNLSASVNIEETDLYVPGTSKQTLDNLARENARLRSLLKNTEHQSGKKSSDNETQELKTLVENLESDKNQLQAQLQEGESIKLTMVRQYEETFASLKKDMAEEKERLMIEIEKYKLEASEMLKNSCTDHRDKKSVECQTAGMQLNAVDNLKQTLKHFMQQCKQLDEDLDSLNLSDSQQAVHDAKPEEDVLEMKAEEYQQMKEKLQEITLMNQRWQIHSDAKERQHIATLSELKSEIEAWKQEAELNRGENMRLAHIVEDLQRALRQKPQIDPSMIEILKQQIQVCTEDFNNERKDHQQVLTQKKQLQDEVEELKLRNEGLRQELENQKLRRSSSSSGNIESRQMIDRRSWHPGQYSPQLSQQQQPYQQQPQLHSHVQARGEDLDEIPQLPSIPFLSNSGAVARMNPPLSYGRRAKSDSPFAFECEVGPVAEHVTGAMSQFMSHSQSDLVGGSSKKGQTGRQGGLVSMPPLKRRSSDIDVLKSRGVMACPKCCKEFPEDQTEMLLSHIDACKD